MKAAMMAGTRRVRQALVIGACAVLAGVAADAVMSFTEPLTRLAGQVHATMDRSGVTHPVTAVLLNFRGYDTLLEIAVLLLALLGVVVAGAGDGTGQRRLPSAPHAFLQALTRLVAPVMVLVAGYLLWAGAHRPGGAFQAAAVLAAGIVLLFLAGLLPERTTHRGLMRAGLIGGFLVFLAVATGPIAAGGALLQYPEHYAGALILLIETGLTLSLALILSGLFLRQSDEFEEEEE